MHTRVKGQRMERAKPHYRTSVRITAVLLFIILAIGGLELGLRVALTAPETEQLSLASQIRNKLNTAEENRADLPMYLPRQGGECVRRDYSKLNWTPRFGFNSKSLDKGCARKLFSSGKIKVVMFGGSTMANVGATNYLTSLDYYAFGQHDEIVSINLAEPGARLSNMLARFIDEVTDLKPDVALFLDGFNEFYSLRYGGRPGDDALTMAVRQRIEHPTVDLLTKVLNLSRLAQVTLIRTGILPNSIKIPQRIDLARVNEEVGYYLRARENADALCAHYSVKCLFILQPIAVSEDAPAGSSTDAIVRENAKYFPHDREIFSYGYEQILKVRGDRYLNASSLMRNVPDTYLDVVHLSKVGNAKLGSFFYSTVKAVMTQAPL